VQFVAPLAQPHACDHIVQFYETDAELVGHVGEYLTPAETAVVIATEAHRDALAAEVPDPGSVVWLDARATLERITRDGEVDPAAFAGVVGGVIRTATAGGRPVRAFGEMVALLWQRGDVAGALALETLWNELLAAVPFFSLYCAYPSVADAGDFARICHAHTAVEANWDFPAELTAASEARHRLTETLARLGHPGALLDDARVVVTELATNAVRHADSAFSVSVTGDGARVRIGVRDCSRAMPAPQPPSPHRLSGRGLLLVSALATRWGVEPRPDGKVVWAELRA
jgi:anti-sigma regulatory factor (Ser/Thr protein kinase)